jgi:large subunit ribosomal protein L13
LSPKQIFDKAPERLVEKAIRGMLPKNKLGRALFRNLYVYQGDAHKHEAQQPTVININELK